MVGGTNRLLGRALNRERDDDRRSTTLPPALLALEDGTVFRGFGFGARRRRRRRGRVQHRDHRLPGGADRPVVPRADRHHDRARDRQRRRQPGRLRVGAAVVRGLRRARAVAAGVELARVGIAARAARATTASPGITGIDTRALTRRIRAVGRAARGDHAAPSATPRRAVERARSHPSLEGRDLVREVTAARRLRVGRAGVAGRRRLGGAPPSRRPSASTSSPTTSASSATSCAACATSGCRVTRRARGDAGAATCWRIEARRHLPVQRPRRSGRGRLRGRGGARADRGRSCRCSASAWATRSSGWRWAARPTS